MLVDVKKPEHPLDGLWLHSRGYVLNNELLSKEIRKRTLVETGLKLTEIDDFWILAKGEFPLYSWEELVKLSIKILSSEMTRLTCMTMWSKELPEVDFNSLEPIDLPVHEIKVSKNIKVTCNWVNYHNNEAEFLNKFRFYGENTSEPAMGTWLHWIAFATQILSSENTNRVCPKLYCREIGFVC